MAALSRVRFPLGTPAKIASEAVFCYAYAMKNNDLAQRYDRIYGKVGPNYGQGQPSKVIQQATKYINSGDVLDLGSGEGRNTLYLASKGFNVTAIDLSKVAIDNLRKSLQEKNLTATTIVGDFTKFDFDKNYQIITSSFALFHLPPEDAIKMIAKIKDHTDIGGLNALATFTRDSDFYRHQPNIDEYFPESGELKNLYSDWEILEYEETKVNANDRRPDKGPGKVVNTAVMLLARKTK